MINVIFHIIIKLLKLETVVAIKTYFPTRIWNPRVCVFKTVLQHYSGVIMNAMATQITSVSIVYSTVCSDQRKHQSSAPLAFVREIYRWPVNSPHKRPVTRKMCPFDDVIMLTNSDGYVTQIYERQIIKSQQSKTQRTNFVLLAYVSITKTPMTNIIFDIISIFYELETVVTIHIYFLTRTRDIRFDLPRF